MQRTTPFSSRTVPPVTLPSAVCGPHCLHAMALQIGSDPYCHMRRLPTIIECIDCMVYHSIVDIPALSVNDELGAF